jgi:putative Ca2+/H+ antiporter (TMEM165/GDT1 family)
MVLPSSLRLASSLGGDGRLLLLGPLLGTALVAEPAHAAVGDIAASIAGGSQIADGFIQALLLVFFSELGDKTFFIALLLALQRRKSEVFAGTFGALAVMTVISVVLGQVLHQLDELTAVQGTGVPWDDVLAVILLVIFGVQTLQNAKDAEGKAKEEKEEAEEEVAARFSASLAGTVLTTFAVVFAAEWGDKSFLATIALSAASSPLGVALGAITAHGGASAIAVLGGGYLSKSVSESTLQYGGGFLFLAFAAVTAAEIVQKVVV